MVSAVPRPSAAPSCVRCGDGGYLCQAGSKRALGTRTYPWNPQSQPLSLTFPPVPSQLTASALSDPSLPRTSEPGRGRRALAPPLALLTLAPTLGLLLPAFQSSWPPALRLPLRSSYREVRLERGRGQLIWKTKKKSPTNPCLTAWGQGTSGLLPDC